MNSEIGDILAEFENRISTLEMLHTQSYSSYKETKIEPQPKKETFSNSAITELKSKFLYLQNKLNAHLDKKKRSFKKYDT